MAHFRGRLLADRNGDAGVVYLVAPPDRPDRQTYRLNLSAKLYAELTPCVAKDKVTGDTPVVTVHGDIDTSGNFYVQRINVTDVDVPTNLGPT